MKHSTVLIIALLAAVLTLPALAQERQPRGNDTRRGGDPTARLKTVVAELNLDGDQKTKADEILQRVDAEIAKSRADNQGRDSFRAAAEATRAAGEDIAAILDEDQRALYRQKLTDAPRGGVTPGGTGQGGPGQGGFGQGGFGQDRPARVIDLPAQVRTAAASIVMEPDQRAKSDALVADIQKKYDALKADALAQMKAILPEDQYLRFERSLNQSMSPSTGGRSFGQNNNNNGGNNTPRNRAGNNNNNNNNQRGNRGAGGV